MLRAAAPRPSHAYLFVGPDAIGKRSAAIWFAQALNCKSAADPAADALGCGVCSECRAIDVSGHPDVRVWELAEGEKTFKVERVRELIAAVQLAPYRGRRKVHVIAAFDTIGPAGANALLKTLEEPPDATTLVLIARDLDSVLPTLISRCQVVPFGLSPPDTIAEALSLRYAIAPDAARAAAFESQGRMGRAIAIATEGATPPVWPAFPEPGREAAWADAMAAGNAEEQLAALDQLLAALRDVALVAAGAPDAALVYRHERERVIALADRAPVSSWVARARAVETARERLARHAHARLVLDELGTMLVRGI